MFPRNALKILLAEPDEEDDEEMLADLDKPLRDLLTLARPIGPEDCPED